MAIYHCSVKLVKRSAGRSATAAAAYRSGDRIVDQRTGEIHDYTRRSGVESTELVFPDHVTTRPDREKLWNTAETSETRKNAQVAREVEIALPDELTADQRRELAVDFARQIAGRYNVAADVCIHQPGKEGDQRNHHAHILLTTRTIESDGTLGKKTRILDDRKTGPAEIQKIRETWAQVCNASLEKYGHAERIDHRSLREQGEERPATKHQGPAVTAIERKHVAAVIRREFTDEKWDLIYSLDEYTQQRRAEGNIPAVTRIGELNQAIRELERLEAKRPKPKAPPPSQRAAERPQEPQEHSGPLPGTLAYYAARRAAAARQAAQERPPEPRPERGAVVEPAAAPAVVPAQQLSVAERIADLDAQIGAIHLQVAEPPQRTIAEQIAEIETRIQSLRQDEPVFIALRDPDVIAAQQKVDEIKRQRDKKEDEVRTIKTRYEIWEETHPIKMKMGLTGELLKISKEWEQKYSELEYLEKQYQEEKERRDKIFSKTRERIEEEQMPVFAERMNLELLRDRLQEKMEEEKRQQTIAKDKERPKQQTQGEAKTSRDDDELEM